MADDDATLPGVAELPVSLAEHVRRVLHEDIRAGRLKPGDRVAEKAVMQRAGVSRTPVREGMQLLQSEGLVVVNPRRGVRVAQALTHEEALRVYDCRIAVEPHILRELAPRLTDAQLDAVRRVVDRFERALAEPAPTLDFSLADSEFHQAILRPSDSPLLAVFRSYWSKLQLELTRLVYDSEAPRVFHREHVGILEALERREAGGASERLAEHIMHGRRVLDRAFVERERGGG